MKINFFSITFWFNIFRNHAELINEFQEEFQDEFANFNVANYTDNYLVPIMSAINKEKKTNITFSQISLQYNMDMVTLDDIEEFKNKALKIFNILEKNNISILHTAILINGEKEVEDALKVITDNTITNDIISEDLVDMTLKLGKKHEDLFYKIVTILNKKQIKLPRRVDEEKRLIPIPLISWNGVMVEKELVECSYEINDKYSFDFTKNYHTTEFYLNKMLFVLKQDFISDIENVIENGKF